MGQKNQPSLEGHVSGQANNRLTRPAHALAYSQVIEEVVCNSEDGLASSEARSRLEQYGRNDLGDDASIQPLKIFLQQVANAMTLVSPPFSRAHT